MSDIMVDSLIAFNGINDHLWDNDVPQWLSTGISNTIEFPFWQVLDLLGIIIMMAFSNSFPFVFSKMKTEAEEPIDISQSHFSGLSRHNLPSSKCLTSNCCLVFVLTSCAETLWLSCVCNETKWKHFFSGLLETEPTATHFKTFMKTNRKLKQGEPLIIKLSGLRFLSIRSTGCWQQLVPLPVLQLETAVMSATCAAITSRAGNC